jgi:prepilin-type N-terminal cleavage/methylation domain-containing protein
MRTERRQRGHTLAELLTVVALILVASSIAVPRLRAYAVESHLLGAGRVFKGKFREAHSMAVRSNAYTAIRFERPDGRWQYSIYRDGDLDGVTSADIAAGRDPRVAGPFPLEGGAPGVRVGINPGVPAPPPETGLLDPSGDPIRFSADMLSFSPLGTATPGTFYLAGQHAQAAVRVTAGSARVRLMVCRGTRWLEKP